MKLSVIIPIFNRSQLFNLGLQTLTKQTLSNDKWDLILVDDMSTEDLDKVYSKYSINVTHIRFNPKDHPYYRGYHTASLAINLGIKHATSDIICITQPEMLHDVENLTLGIVGANKGVVMFGKVILSHPKFTSWISQNMFLSFNDWWTEANRLTQPFLDNELYWYIMFLKKDWAIAVNGVDESYMAGVYAEDDNFKDRLKFYLQKGNDNQSVIRLNPEIRGIHINHEYEGDLYPKQDRNASFWQKGAENNRAKYRNWCSQIQQGLLNKIDVIKANQDLEWGDKKYIISIKKQYAADLC